MQRGSGTKRIIVAVVVAFVAAARWTLPWRYAVVVYIPCEGTPTPCTPAPGVTRDVGGGPGPGGGGGIRFALSRCVRSKRV